VFFVTAGTFDYWQAWLYMAVLFTPLLLALIYFYRRDPAFLERRIRSREPRARQRTAIGASALILILAYVLPGLDQRFGWSHVPVSVVLAADLVSLLSYLGLLLVLRENRYAARTVQVQAGQHVISTGPYRIVRHPMYLAATVMYLAGPVALGSYWAVLPGLLLPLVLAMRLLDEEHLLAEELPGYRDYQARTKFRLIPGIW
jgi:protein-S-isoprenylcysteine O-methyltransferase Ste14